MKLRAPSKRDQLGLLGSAAAVLPAQRSPPSSPGPCAVLRRFGCDFLQGLRLGSRLLLRAHSRRIDLTAPVELRSCVGISASVRHKGVVDDVDEYLMQLSVSYTVTMK